MTLRVRSYLSLVLAALPVQESGPRAVPLPAPSAVLDAEFTAVGAVRELKDGRVLVVDISDRKVFVGDWRTRAATQIGREGNGPGEYALPRALFPVSADSTLLPDPRNGRWLLLAGATIVETVPADAPAIRSGARSPLGADYAGNVFATKPRVAPARRIPWPP